MQGRSQRYMGFHVICTGSPRSVLFPTLQWGHRLTLSQVFASYSRPPSVSLHSAHSFVSLHPIAFILCVLWGLCFDPSWVPHSWLCFNLCAGVLTICQVPVHMHANFSSLLFPTTNLFGRHCDYPHCTNEETKSPHWPKVTQRAAERAKIQGRAVWLQSPILNHVATTASRMGLHT